VIFWICLTVYILLGVISGKIIYNKFFDETYQQALSLYLRTGLAREAAEDNAYDLALNSPTPGVWGIGVFTVWPFYWFVELFLAIFKWAARLVDKIIPSKAHKAKIARDKAKARRAELEEYEKALEVVQGE